MTEEEKNEEAVEEPAEEVVEEEAAEEPVERTSCWLFHFHRLHPLRARNSCTEGSWTISWSRDCSASGQSPRGSIPRWTVSEAVNLRPDR